MTHLRNAHHRGRDSRLLTRYFCSRSESRVFPGKVRVFRAAEGRRPSVGSSAHVWAREEIPAPLRPFGGARGSAPAAVVVRAQVVADHGLLRILAADVPFGIPL